MKSMPSMPYELRAQIFISNDSVVHESEDIFQLQNRLNIGHT